MIPSPTNRPKPGDIIVSGQKYVVNMEPLVGSDVSTPLEEDESEGIIPPSPLWAMKERRHIQWHLLPVHERHPRIRECIGAGDDAVYVIDDGPHHVMLGRRVGTARGECEYCLLGRAPIDVYRKLQQGRIPLDQAFDTADELALCGIAIEEDIRSSNIFDVDRYQQIDEVPDDYRPGAKYQQFSEDLEINF